MSNTPSERKIAEPEVESRFERAACVIFLGATLASFTLYLLGSPAFSGNDLSLAGISLAALVLNLRSWRRFAEVIGGSKKALKAFVLLKSASLALLVGIIAYGKLRGLAVFFLCLVLFLFLGSVLILRSGRGN